MPDSTDTKEVGFVYDDHPESMLPMMEVRFNGKTISVKALTHAAEVMRLKLKQLGIDVHMDFK